MHNKFINILFLLAAAMLSANAGAQVVISQFYGGSGCTTAMCSTYDRDYIELFNTGTNSATLNNYSVQYHSKSNTGTWNMSVLPASVTIPAGGYYLIGEGAEGTGGTPINTATYDFIDTTGNVLNMSATDGVVALVNNATKLTCLSVSDCSSATNSAVVDLIGFGASVIYRGTAAAAAPSKTTSDLRAGNGCTNTNNNASDFTVGPPTPRNSSATVNPCSGGGTGGPAGAGSATPNSVPNDGTTSTTLSVNATPGTGATSVTSVTVNLSPIGGATSAALTDSGDHAHFSLAGVTVSTTTATGSKSLTATITDNLNQTGSATIALTVTQVPKTIMTVNGHGTTSPLKGQTVTIGGGVVTAWEAKGFFMQDPAGDGDITTSDGVYVYLNHAPTVAVGHSVTVTGTVDQYDNYEIEIDGTVTVTDNGPGTMPTPYDLGSHPPTDDDQGICANASINPLTDGYAATQYACLNDMLVTFSGATVVGAVGGSSPDTASGADGGGGNTPDRPQYFYATLAPAREFREPGIVAGDPATWNTVFPTYKANYAGPVFSGHPDIFQIYYQSLTGFNVGDLPDVGYGHGVYNVGQTVGVTAGVLQQFAFTAKIGNTYYPDSPVGYEIYPLTGNAVTVSGAGLNLPQAVADAAPGTLTIGTQNGLHFFNDVNDGSDSSAYVDACLATEANVNISGNVGGISAGGLGIPLEPGDNDTCPTQAQYDTRLSKMSLQIRNVLKAPQVQVLQETENLSVLGDIATTIHSDSVANHDSPAVAYKPFLFTGNDPQGINIGVLVKDDSDIVVNSVSQLALNATTSACGIGTSCLLNDRPPVLLDATYKGAAFRVLAIYDRSLSSLSTSTYVGPKRRAQAEQVARIVQTLQTDGSTLLNGSTGDGCSKRVDGSGASASCTDIAGSSTTPLVVVGDFNANEFSDGYVDVTGTIMGTVDTDPTHSIFPPTANYVAPNVPTPTLVNPIEPTTDPAANPLTWNPNYSYSFDGLSEEIDHILLTRAAFADFVRISHSHGNSDVSSASSDVSDPTTPRRLSDHDGQVITLAIDRLFADGFDGTP